MHKYHKFLHLNYHLQNIQVYTTPYNLEAPDYIHHPIRNIQTHTSTNLYIYLSILNQPFSYLLTKAIFSLLINNPCNYIIKIQIIINMEYHKKEDIDQDSESELDILSLCDLPIYSSESTDHDQDYNSKELLNNSSESSFSSEDQENIFEFFSDEWNISTKTATVLSSKSTSSSPNDENIIFCGKIISKNNVVLSKEVEKKNSLIPWKPNSMYFRSKNKSKKGGDVTSKVSIYMAPVKSKLLLVLFGLPPKFPADRAELMTDIRNRQSRRAPSTFFPENGGCNGEEVVAVRRRTSENGLWRFIKAATCFGGQTRGNDVV